MFKLFFLVVTISLISGCAAYRVPPTDLQNENISTQHAIKPESIHINKKYDDIKQVKFIVLKTQNNNDYKIYKKFMTSMLNKVGFTKILTEEEFTQLIIKNNLDNKIGNLYDLISLHKIYEELGEFLVISLSLNHTGNSFWDNQLIILDPKEPRVLVKIHEYKTNWLDLDSEFNYPTINFINDWYKQSL